MKFSRKIEIKFSKEDERILDGQSKICNWLYNRLLEAAIMDYKENNNANKLLDGRNLRDLVPKLKKDNEFLKSVHSSPLKNTAFRLKDAYHRFFDKKGSFPHYRSWKDRWFSLLYDEPNKGFKLLEGKNLSISLGIDKTKKILTVLGELKEKLPLREDEKIKTFRLCKQQGNRFYAIFCIERPDAQRKDVKNWIAIDPNHKNLLMAVDNKGITYEFEKLSQIRYWDKIIDEIKSKRDLCLKKAKKVDIENGSTYYIPSRRWQRLNKALDNAYNCRREQIKSACFSIANWLSKNYDYAAFGDYTPSKKTAVEDTMHRSMLNQDVTGTLRKIVNWVMQRSGKTFSLVDEKDTTAKCCICGNKEKKAPNVREFTCIKCNSTLNRDINSGINIAKKDKLLSGSDYAGWNLFKPTYTAKWDFAKGKLHLQAAQARN